MEPEEAKKVRIALGKSQEGLAEIIGTSSGNVSRWENGKTKLSTGAVMMYKALKYLIHIKKHKSFLAWLKK